jgi:hypothetical protein
MFQELLPVECYHSSDPLQAMAIPLSGRFSTDIEQIFCKQILDFTSERIPLNSRLRNLLRLLL